MRHGRIAFMGLAAVLAACEAWAIDPIVPDAVVERHLLERVDGATREGGTLELQTDAGVVTFVDRVQAGEGYAKYRLADHLRKERDSFFLVRAFGHEGNGYVLVSRKTGQKIGLYGRPSFSPDGQRFVDVSLDLEAGYRPNLVRIYKLEDGGYVTEWKHSYQGIKGPADPVWLDDSRVVLFEVTFDEVAAVSELRKSPVIVEWEDGEWNGPRPLR